MKFSWWSALSFLILLPPGGRMKWVSGCSVFSCQQSLTCYSDFVSSWIFNSWTIVERFKVTLNCIKISIQTKLRITERNLAMHMYCIRTPHFLCAYFSKKNYTILNLYTVLRKNSCLKNTMFPWAKSGWVHRGVRSCTKEINASLDIKVHEVLLWLPFLLKH